MSKVEIFPNDFKLYQGEQYHFTSDSILLAKFFKFRPNDVALEICAGSGVIGCYAYSIQPCKMLHFVEINSADCEVIAKNISLNNMSAQVHNIDAKTINESTFGKRVDMIICNPPYEKITNKMNDNERIAIARHEVAINLQDIASICAKTLKSGGHLYMVHKAERVAEIIVTLAKYKLSVKRLEFVYSGNKAPYLVLIDATLDGKDGTKVTIKENV